MYIMVSKTHTMALGRIEIKSVESQEKIRSKKKDELTFFAIITMKSVDILFNKTIDNMKRLNKTM